MCESKGDETKAHNRNRESELMRVEGEEREGGSDGGRGEEWTAAQGGVLTF